MWLKSRLSARPYCRDCVPLVWQHEAKPRLSLADAGPPLLSGPTKTRVANALDGDPSARGPQAAVLRRPRLG
jgi:hypothetical protein